MGKPGAPWCVPVRRARVLAVSLVLAAHSAAAHAHLMVAQKGTLNFSADGAFLLLSLPVSAFEGVDDDGDRLLSTAELRAHAGRIEHQVRAGVQLHRDGRALTLEGIMLSLSPPDSTPDAPASQLVVMGRFALGADRRQAKASNYRFTLARAGQTAAERVFDIVFTRASQRQALRFAPGQTAHALFPSVPSVAPR